MINGWISEGHQAGAGWSPKVRPTVDNYGRLAAALTLGEATSGDPDCSRLILTIANGGFPIPGDTIGAAIGHLDAGTALKVARLANAFGTPELTLLYREDGTPRLEGDVPAIIAGTNTTNPSTD